MFSLGRLGKLERSVMEIVWRSDGDLSVHDVHSALDRNVAYTTVMTTLDRLFKKGLLARNQSGRAYLYSPRMPRHRFAMELVSSLVADIGERDAALLDELEQFVREKRKKLDR
jgi:predicted transcriptional regulator